MLFFWSLLINQKQVRNWSVFVVYMLKDSFCQTMYIHVTMNTKLINSLTLLLLTQLVCTYLCIATNQELLRGFTISPDPSTDIFQPLLTDSIGNFSLGLLRVNSKELFLSVVHVPSYEPLWTANPSRPMRWEDATKVFFNGSLVISDPRSGIFWSTLTDGDRVLLTNSSNLQIQKKDESNTPLWQSFHYPTDTIVENQNFTSTMALVSSNGLYSMRLGDNFIGLYAKFGLNTESASGTVKDQIYFKHKALQAKKEIIESQGPIYLVLKPDGYLGMYQIGSVPVDVLAFNTFNNPEDRTGIRRVRIEPDGNLKGYFWTGSSWVLDYQAIADTCELPSACGPYGLCSSGKGCSCLDNSTDFKSGRCGSPVKNLGDFCGLQNSKFKVLTRSRINLPSKELMGYEQMDSWEQCQGTCEKNCSCWGVVYNNASGFCYSLDYPIQSMVSVDDESKFGYFKVRERTKKRSLAVGLGVGFVFLFVVLLAIGGTLGVKWYKLRSKRGVTRYVEDDGVVGVGPYKDLATASFRSLELTEKR